MSKPSAYHEPNVLSLFCCVLPGWVTSLLSNRHHDSHRWPAAHEQAPGFTPLQKPSRKQTEAEIQEKEEERCCCGEGEAQSVLPSWFGGRCWSYSSHGWDFHGRAGLLAQPEPTWVPGAPQNWSIPLQQDELLQKPTCSLQHHQC